MMRLPCLLSLLTLTFALLSGSASAQQSASHIAVDVRTGKILLANRPSEKLAIAGLTNVTTASVVLDWLDASGTDKNSLVTVPSSAMTLGSPNPLGLQPGDRYSIRDALFCALNASDAISAHTLAENIGNQMMQVRGGGRASSGVAFFVDQMNALAAARLMNDTVYRNPHGLDMGRQTGHSTAADVAKITIYALEKPSFNFIVSQKTREIAYYRGNQKLAFRIYNTNKLLEQYDIKGGKTGRTPRAGECFVASVQRPDRISAMGDGRSLRTPYHIVMVTLNSADRFGQVSRMIPQAWGAYEQWLAAGLIMKPEERIAIPSR